MRPRVGHIQFLNCLPLFYALVKNDGLLDIELIKGAPRELSAKLLANELDIAAIPAIEYARNHEQLALLPDLSISSFGAIKSILLLSKYELPELDGKVVALTNTSSTSQILTKVVLEDLIEIKPQYFEAPPDLAQMLREADAALLIGDDALRSLDNKELKAFDLGHIWTEHTGKTMVYAVWATRTEFVCEQPEALQQVAGMLKDSVSYSLSHIEEVAEYAAKYEDFSADFLTDYFRTLRYDFSSETQEGLSYFLDEAFRLGFLREKAPLRLIEDVICRQ